MVKNSKFSFEVSLSERNYNHKTTSVEYAKMRWTKRNVTVSQFITMVASGYSYCHIYFNNLRRKDKFLYTNIVSIDVDDSDVCLADFIVRVQLKPTFAYETFSNGAEGKYSYRLVYVVNERMNRRCFTEVYDKICRMTGLEKTKDHCGKVITQLMNGTNPTAFIYRSDIIYSTVTDLPVDSTLTEQIEENRESLIPLVSKNKLPNYNFIYNNNQKQYKPKVQNRKLKSTVLDSMLLSLEKDGREKFLEYCKPYYRLVRWSKLSYNEYGYTVIPEDHLSLFVRYMHIGKECVINRFKDGEKRRNRLFIDGCIIRKIKPEIKVHEMFYNLMHRVHYYYDNSDGILSDSLIAQKAIDVMEYDVDAMEFKSMDAGRVTTSPGYCRDHGVTRYSHSRKALMIENYAGISEWYDSRKSVI